MQKKAERRIPYRVYKKVFPDCDAHDYEDGSIVVKFPQEYLTDKVVLPDGWHKGCNYVESPEDERCVYINISWYTDGGVKYYDAYVLRYNQFSPKGRRKDKQYFYSFAMAMEWAVNAATT